MFPIVMHKGHEGQSSDSKKTQPLYTYFKILEASSTNPSSQTSTTASLLVVATFTSNICCWHQVLHPSLKKQMTLQSQTYVVTTTRWSSHGHTCNLIHISNRFLTYHITTLLPLELPKLNGLPELINTSHKDQHFPYYFKQSIHRYPVLHKHNTQHGWSSLHNLSKACLHNQ